MSASRKAPLLVATAAALGLIAATVAAIVLYTASSNRSSSRQRGSTKGGQASTAESHTPAMGKAAEEMQPPPAPPLAITPAPTGSKALVVCAEGREEETVAAAWASASRRGGAAVSVCPPGFLGSHVGTSAGTYDSIVVEDGENVSGAALGEILKLLKAGGKVTVVVSPHGTTTAAATATAASKRPLTFAGFIEVAPSPEDGRVLIGKRAPWNAGASAPVRVSFRKTTKPAEAVAAAAAAAGVGPGVVAANGVSNGNGSGDRSAAPAVVKKTWTLALDDDDEGGMFGGGGEEDDLVDEDALLESSAPVKRASEADATGCATKRRACKDCSCGRAEMEEAGEGSSGPPPPVASVSDVDDALTSACGNCSKGDAFRCGGCPFLGKPAFEKGQEKLIMLSDLDSQQDN